MEAEVTSGKRWPPRKYRPPFLCKILLHVVRLLTPVYSVAFFSWSLLVVYSSVDQFPISISSERIKRKQNISDKKMCQARGNRWRESSGRTWGVCGEAHHTRTVSVSVQMVGPHLFPSNPLCPHTRKKKKVLYSDTNSTPIWIFLLSNTHTQKKVTNTPRLPCPLSHLQSTHY
jgi:hypothetical protein